MNKYDLRITTQLSWITRRPWVCKYEDDGLIRWKQINRGWQLFRTTGELTEKMQTRYPIVLMEWYE